jgi:hypothetical protein
VDHQPCTTVCGGSDGRLDQFAVAQLLAGLLVVVVQLDVDMRVLFNDERRLCVSALRTAALMRLGGAHAS